jgi:amino acid permease
VQYFNNKFALMISRIDHGEFITWVAIMYSHLDFKPKYRIRDFVFTIVACDNYFKIIINVP